MHNADEVVSRPEGTGIVNLTLQDCRSSKILEYYSAFANSGGGEITVTCPSRFESDKDEEISLLRKRLQDVSNISPNPVMSSHFRKSSEGFILDVPYADRLFRPVYLDGSPETGTFVWKDCDICICGAEQVRSMIRDRSDGNDGKTMEDFDASVLNTVSLGDFRSRLKKDHIWSSLDVEKLMTSSLATVNRENRLVPAVAGILLFSDHHTITSRFKGYRLRYSDGRWAIDSEDGRWSGNIQDFRSEVSACISSIYGDMSESVMELVTNALIHSDYHLGDGVSVIYGNSVLKIINYGMFRSSVEESIKGKRDRRNPIIANILSSVSTFRGLGNAIVRLNENGYRTDVSQNLIEGKVTVTVKPSKIKDIELSIYAKRVLELLIANKDMVIDEISEKIGLGRRQTERYLSELKEKGILKREGSRRSGRWKIL
ncbi:MAG: winged helix-turn-helix transcriptional regulator [Candidatus Methanomethylophilaceae archaeon]|jgi:ATP-dependent DNA helicase RecG